MIIQPCSIPYMVCIINSTCMNVPWEHMLAVTNTTYRQSKGRYLHSRYTAFICFVLKLLWAVQSWKLCHRKLIQITKTDILLDVTCYVMLCQQHAFLGFLAHLQRLSPVRYVVSMLHWFVSESTIPKWAHFWGIITARRTWWNAWWRLVNKKVYTGSREKKFFLTNH